MTGRFNVAILGASGLVGQRLQELLWDHPMFRVVAIAGSPNSVGLMHEEIEWRLETPHDEKMFTPEGLKRFAR